VGEFLMNNLALVMLFLASGVMLVWPELSRLAGGGANEVNTLEATRRMNQGGSLVLDVREAAEFASGHLPGARHIPLAELGKRIDEIRKFQSKPVLIACRSGSRAGAACRALKSAGFTDVAVLKGGIAAWREANLPVEK
jgi:rhodanese-related sulfurtransferase